MNYYRTSDGSLHDLTDEQFAGFQVNGKASLLRVYVVDPQPTPSAVQVVERGPVVVGPVEAHQTWTLRDKTQAERNADDNAADKPTIQAVLAALNASIQSPDTSGTAAERIAKLEGRALRLERIARHYVRSL